MLYFKLILKDLIKNKKFSFLFTTNLFIGLLGLIFLLTLSSSIQSVLNSKSKEFLGGDFAIRARRLLNEAEIQKMESRFSHAERSRMIRLYTMGRAKDIGKLVRIRGIETNYPMYGKIEFKESGEQTPEDMNRLQKNLEIWVYPELATQFKLKVGDFLKIGNLEFKVSKIIERDPSDTSSGISLAPRAYISLKSLQKTGLVSELSTLRDARIYKLARGIDVEEVKLSIEKNLEDHTIRLQTAKEAGQNVGRALSRIFDYIGLLMLVALIICFIGCNYLFRSYLQGQIYNLALYKLMGISRKGISFILFGKILILSIFSWGFAQLVSFLLFIPLGPSLEKLTKIDFNLSLNTEMILVGLVVALFGPIFFLLSYFYQYSSLPAKKLIVNIDLQEISFLKKVLLFLPSATFIILMSIYISHSYFVGLNFVGAITVSFVILIVFAFIYLKIVSKFNFKNPFIKISVRNLFRDRSGSLNLFLSMGIAAVLINFIPQMQSSIQSELDAPESKKIPQLFLFDIQSNQLDDLQNKVKELGSKLNDITPLVRSRLIKINDKDFEKSSKDQELFSTRENQRDRFFRNRGVNLTYAYNKTPKITIVEGKEFSGIYDWSTPKEMEVSIERRYAKRIGVKLDDKITLDIQGMEIEARVVNIKSVNWLTFRPNFFVEMQPGTIDDAPKSFIGVLSELTNEQKEKMQFELANEFPSISMIDVSRTVKDILRVIDQLQKIISVIALISVLIGLFVVFSMGQFESSRFSKEYNMLKVIGSTKEQIFGIFSNQFIFLIVPAIICGVSISFLLTIFINSVILEIQSVFVFWPAPLILFLTSVFALLIVRFSVSAVVSQSPAKLLED